MRARNRCLKRYLALCCLPVLGLPQASSSEAAPFTTWIEFEHATAVSGLEFSRYAEELQSVSPGDMAVFENINFINGNYTSIDLLAKRRASGTISVRIDKRDGQVIATVPVVTGYEPRVYSASLANVTGVHDIYFTFEGAEGFCILNRFGLVGTVDIESSPKTYYVDGSNGSDEQANDGLSPQKAFRTIARASAVMKPGGTCLIKEGVYRETISPVFTGTASAPLTYQAAPGATVVISAGEPLSNWTTHSGRIYKTKMTFSMGSSDRNQLFVDGVAMVLARAPNVAGPCPDDEKYVFRTPCYINLQDEVSPLLIPALQLVDDNCGVGVGKGSPATSFDACFKSYQPLDPGFLNRPANFFKGGIYFNFATEYWGTSGRILSSEPTTSSLAKMAVGRWSGANTGSPHGGRGGFVGDLLGLLDAPGEWYRDSATSTVYLWMPASDHPAGHVVEAKRRLLVANLSSKSYVNFRGLKFIGGSMTLENADHCRIEDCHFRNVSQLYLIGNNNELAAAGYGSKYDPSSGYKGIYVSGHDNVFYRSSVAISAGSGIILDGYRNTIENCRIRDCNYLGTYDACIYVMNRRFDERTPLPDGYWGTGHKIIGNTLHNASRELIHVCTTGPTSNDPLKIRKNDFYNFMLNSTEGGAIYVYGDAGGHSDASYNWFHGHGFMGRSGAIVHDVGHRTPWYIHHNVYWQENTFTSRRIHAAWYVDSVKNVLYNNTIVDKTDWRTRDSSDTTTGYRWADGGANTLYAAGDTTPWQFTNAPERNYTLRQTSPAVDAGVLVAGVPMSFNGKAPDLGAYEYGEARWTAGADWDELPLRYPARSVEIAPQSRSANNRAAAPSLRRYANRLVLTASPNAPATIVLLSTAGRAMCEERIDRGRSATIALRRLPAGTYIALVNSTTRAFSRKITVVR